MDLKKEVQEHNIYENLKRGSETSQQYESNPVQIHVYVYIIYVCIATQKKRVQQSGTVRNMYMSNKRDSQELILCEINHVHEIRAK